MREGVCFSCQSIRPIVPKSFSPEDDDLSFLPPEEGEAAEWVMATHDAFGRHCEGSGTMPQAVLRKEKRGWDDMTEDEIKTAIRGICNSSKSNQEVKDRLRDELGYPYGAVVTSTSHGSMHMTMVMVNGPRGNTISI
jgi:hypothetical protein